MLGSVSTPVLALFLVSGVFCFFASLGSWLTGLKLLIVAVLFGGIVALNLVNGAFAIGFRDVCIVLPLYLAFFFSSSSRSALVEMPRDVALGFALVTGYFVLSLFNSTGAPLLQLLIGLKVWLYYLPFVAVGMALAADAPALRSVMRFFLCAGLIPCGVGLVQYLLIRLMGFDAAMALFFGANAKLATQGFAFFDLAGGIYRIPATFSFVAQYTEFLYLFLTVAAIAANSDPEPRYRRLGNIAIFVAVVAGLFSGTRAVAVTFPLIILGYACFRLVGTRLFLSAPIAAIVGLGITWVAGVNLVAFFLLGTDLAVFYSENFFLQQILEGLGYGVFGEGIGSSTGAARYANGDLSGSFSSLLGFESYFAKIAAELGSIGLMIFVFLLLAIGVRSIVIALRHRSQAVNAFTAPLAIYVIGNIVFSVKGFVLDTDPGNIFFWIAVGLLFQLDRVVTRSAPERAAARVAPPPLGLSGFEANEP